MNSLHVACITKPVILDSGFRTAVVATDPSPGILQMRRHRLGFDQSLQMLKVSLHVKHTSTTDGTAIRAPDMLMVTLLVDAMTALHEHYLLWGCEHVVAADWTVAIG